MSEPSTTGGDTLYRYVDPSGHTHLVDDLADVPADHKGEVVAYTPSERVSLSDLKAAAEKVGDQAAALKDQGLKGAERLQHQVGDVLPFVEDLHLPSVLVGFAASLAVVLAFTVVLKTGRFILKLGLFVAIVLLVAGAYFGWLRTTAGLGDARFSTPGQLIDDAKNAASKVKKRVQSQEKLLKQIEESSR